MRVIKYFSTIICVVSAVVIGTSSKADQYIGFDSRTGHYYLASYFSGLWTDCYDWAQLYSFLSRPGYLATVKDATENEIVRKVIYDGYVNVGIQSMWIGGFKSYKLNPVWGWITDNSFSYTSWGPLEPNNYGGKERYMEMFADGYWNDVGNAGPSSGGYAVIEFEPSQVVVSTITGPTTVNSPVNVTYTITLTTPAPAEGAILYLSTTNSAFGNLPKAVQFAGNASSQTVTFNVPQVASNRGGSLNVYGKYKKSLSVTVTP